MAKRLAGCQNRKRKGKEKEEKDEDEKLGLYLSSFTSFLVISTFIFDKHLIPDPWVTCHGVGVTFPREEQPAVW